ncbi:MAG: DUF4843 domain-containing protein [Prevotellaceae bacterium]|jgi:hypothetical protein|nr:DUF4843 domain-containing protein [Prevotellaceae bacterium]
MKTHVTKLIFTVAAALASSCEYEKLPTYSGQDQVYFAYADNAAVNVVDEVFLHFGYDNPVKQETTLYVSVKVMGSVADVDRPVSVTFVDSLSTATLGRDVELLPAQSLVPAGKALGRIAVKLKNTTALYDTVLTVAVRIVQNEHFHADYVKTRYPHINTEGKIVSTLYRIRFDNAVSMPRLWSENLSTCITMFGEYSDVKFNLMCERLGFTRDLFSYEDGDGDPQELFNARIAPYSKSWNQIINTYLNEFKETNGAPLRDEYGREVKMGLDIS